MALANGVLVHGPTAWACAIRTPSGEIKVAAARKRLFAPGVQTPFLRGPLRLAESFAVVPALRRKLPEARLPFERPVVLGSMIISGRVVRQLRESKRLGPLAKELLAGTLSLAPATLALRGSSLAAYHGAEHITIGTYEHGEPRGKEHERCGSHLVGPLLLTSAVGATLAARAPAALRAVARAGAVVGSMAAATELFGWMVRHPEHPIAKALARPGHELQARIATADPDRAQLEVAEAALQACLALETDGAEHPHRG
jgi:uncharacterized protein YqhQ